MLSNRLAVLSLALPAYWRGLLGFQDFSRLSVVQFIQGQRPVGPASSLAIIKHAEEVGTPVEGPVR